MNDRSDRPDTADEIRAVTISREYGSGGAEIASHLAKRLGWQLIDHAMVERVARAIGTSPEDVEAHDEHAEGTLTQLLTDLQYIDPTFASSVPIGAVLSDDAYRDAVGRVVRAAAARGKVVIVGRGSQVLLAERRDVLRVRIIAPLEQRITYVMHRDGVDRPEATSLLQTKDRERVKFLETGFHRNPEDAHLYDLVLNMLLIDQVSAANIICLMLKPTSA